VTTFGTFLRAVWGDSLARMSGPASVPFTGLALYVDQATSKALWGGLGDPLFRYNLLSRLVKGTSPPCATDQRATAHRVLRSSERRIV